jgi:acyl carrier protein
MTCDLAKIVSIVAGFAERARGVPRGSVTPDTRLLQEGVLDSFSLVELIGELEAALGLQLPDGTLLPEDFESPKVLCARLQAL